MDGTIIIPAFQMKMLRFMTLNKLQGDADVVDVVCYMGLLGASPKGGPKRRALVCLMQ